METNLFAAENNDENHTYIIGHWNYPDNSVNPIYVISNGEDVELFINGISTGHGRQDSKYLFTFDNINFQPGTLTAVSYDKEGNEIGQYSLITSGVPAQLNLQVLNSPEKNPSADPEEIVVQCKIMDFYGRRCFQDNRTVTIEIEDSGDLSNSPVEPVNKCVRKKQLPLHNGVNSFSIKKPAKSGEIKLTAKAQGMAPAYLTVNSSK